MSLVHAVLRFLFGPPPKNRPSPSHPPPLNRSTFKGQPSPRLRQPKPPPAGLTAQQLQEALALASPLTTQRTALPILSCCLLGNGKLAATDLDSYLTLELPDLRVAPVCVSVAQLQKVVRTLRGPLVLSRQEGNLQVNDFLLPGLDPAEFPASPATGVGEPIGPVFMVPPRWSDLLPAVSTDPARLNLSGVCVDLAKGHCVSSDGHRLHALRMAAEGVTVSGIIPLPTARLVARVVTKGEVTGQFYPQRRILNTEDAALLAIEMTKDTPEAVRRKREKLDAELKRPVYVLFRAPGVELWARLVEGEFPDYLPILQRPKQVSIATLPTALVLAALKACLACAPKDRLGVSLTRLPAGVRIRLEATDHGRVERLVECRGWKPGHYIGMNARYLLHALECWQGKEVTLWIKDVATAVHLEDDNLHVVIMPVRVSEPMECQQVMKRGETNPTAADPVSS